MQAIGSVSVRAAAFDWTGKQFSRLVPAFRELGPGPLLIDGEVCALDDNGRPDFGRLKVSLDGKQPLVFYAFDLLVADGDDLARLPLVERRARLEAVRLPAGSSIHYRWHTSDGAALLRAMRENRMEGVVAKRPGAIYSSGDRSEAWLKIKTTGRQEFVVVGWRPPEYGPDDVRGLFLATYDNGQLVYRGSVGTGFTDRLRRQTLEVLKLIRTDSPLLVKGTRRVISERMSATNSRNAARLIVGNSESRICSCSCWESSIYSSFGALRKIAWTPGAP